MCWVAIVCSGADSQYCKKHEYRHLLSPSNFQDHIQELLNHDLRSIGGCCICNKCCVFNMLQSINWDSLFHHCPSLRAVCFSSGSFSLLLFLFASRYSSSPELPSLRTDVNNKWIEKVVLTCNFQGVWKGLYAKYINN